MASQDQIDQAISFLSDPKVREQPDDQKRAFLQAKGLSQQEIQQIMTLTSGNHAPQMAQAPLMPAMPHQLPPPQLRPLPNAYDWKDYLIMSTTTLGFIYGAYHVISNHIIPSIMPPAKTKLDEDKEAMDREFERVEGMLTKLENDQREFINAQNEKSKAIDDTLVQLSSLITDTNERNLRNDETLKYLKLEIESIKTTLLKNLESQKDTITTELQSLTNVTKDIKQEVDAKMVLIDRNGDKAGAKREIPRPSVSPPANLVTNKSYDSSQDSDSRSNSRYQINIPPPTLPSAKDILKDDFPKTGSSPASPQPTKVPQEAGIPAWQLAAEGGN